VSDTSPAIEWSWTPAEQPWLRAGDVVRLTAPDGTITERVVTEEDEGAESMTLPEMAPGVEYTVQIVRHI
jgi:hypothetical protein